VDDRLARPAGLDLARIAPEHAHHPERAHLEPNAISGFGLAFRGRQPEAAPARHITQRAYEDA